MSKRKEQKKQQEALEEKQRKDRRSRLGKTLLESALLIGIGVLLVLRPDLGEGTVALVAGWALIAMGAIAVVVSVLSWPAISLMETVLAVALTGLGIFILVRPHLLSSILGLGLGIYLVIQGLGIASLWLKLRKLTFSGIPQLIAAVLYLGLGITLLCFPLKGALWVIRLIGVALIVWGASGLVLRTIAEKQLHGSEIPVKLED